MHDTARTANLLGAVALAVTDLAVGDATRAAGVSSSGAAALVTLSASPGLSVTELGRRVGLSQPAAARMVDSLEADGLVERRRSAISRGWVTVHSTGSWAQAARRISRDFALEGAAREPGIQLLYLLNGQQRLTALSRAIGNHEGTRLSSM